MAGRSRLAVIILVGFLGIALLIAGGAAVYGRRVWTELSPGSWRTPTKILAHDGEVYLEVYGSEWRVTDPVILEDLPEHVPAAFLAAEDVRFRRHPGIDPIGILRAATTNVRSGGIAQGGSTITQQLAKTRFLTAERTFSRKAAEAMLAILIELRLSKDDILEAYLNDVYLGHREGTTVVGLDEASRVYFDKAPEELSVAEVALLAGMIRAPNRDNPEENAEIARERRDAVLKTMLDRGWIDEEAHDAAVDERVRFRRGSLPPQPHSWYVAALRHELEDRVGAGRVRGGGLTIHTSIDPEMQAAAERAVRDGTRRLRNRYRWLRRGDEPLEAAILSVDPATGGIRAIVGGVDYSRSQYDRTRRMRRQPGSAIKPFAYAAAIADREITAATLLEDQPIEIELSRNDIWRPHNYDEQFRGTVTVREAVEKSLNVPLIRLVADIGPGEVRGMLADARVGSDFSKTPAVALGVDEVGMRDLVAAYTIFPNLGFRTEPHLVDRIENASGRTVYQFKARPDRVLDPAVAYVVHSMLRGVVQRGTASRLRGQGLGHVAGKTGTTNDYRDAWFIGYSPDLLTAAWVGFDEGAPLRISSAEAALPIWAAFMSRASHERSEIAPPEGVEIVEIDRVTGGLWAPGCGERFREAFLAGTEPDESCRGRGGAGGLFASFEEPAVISAEKFQEWMTSAPGAEPIEIVIDPGEPLPGDDPDVLDEREREEIDRQLEDALREIPPPPADAPPAADPPSLEPPPLPFPDSPREAPPRREPPAARPDDPETPPPGAGDRPGRGRGRGRGNGEGRGGGGGRGDG